MNEWMKEFEKSHVLTGVTMKNGDEYEWFLLVFTKPWQKRDRSVKVPSCSKRVGNPHSHPAHSPTETHTQQVTRGHNIVADGWAGASQPHPHPNPPPTHKHTQQVTRGHNIVADEWAGAANPHPHPTPHPSSFLTQIHTQKGSKMLVFPPFDSCWRTDGQTDERTKPLIELRVRN